MHTNCVKKKVVRSVSQGFLIQSRAMPSPENQKKAGANLAATATGHMRHSRIGLNISSGYPLTATALGKKSTHVRAMPIPIRNSIAEVPYLLWDAISWLQMAISPLSDCNHADSSF